MSLLKFTEQEIAFLVENTQKIMNPSKELFCIEQPYFLIDNEFYKTQDAAEAFKNKNVTSVVITNGTSQFRTEVIITKDEEYKYLVYNKYQGTIDCLSLDLAIEYAFDYFAPF